MPPPSDARFRVGDYVQDSTTKHCGEVCGYDYRTRPYTVTVEMDRSFHMVRFPEDRLARVPRGTCSK